MDLYAASAISVAARPSAPATGGATPSMVASINARI